ncbi:MAG: LysR family transcriptional regulator [Idiomarina sp.]|nr:LysR family transcriptional regulator [Idiomarina sp.]
MNQIHSNQHAPSYSKVDLNLLRVLVAIYRERQLGRAAAELALTPSAISHALRRLRDTFDDQLFVRNGRYQQPTALCEKLVPELNEVLARMQGLVSRGRNFSPTTTQRTFRIGMPEALEAELFPRIYKRLQQAAPQAKLESIAVPHMQISDYLLNRKADVVIDVAMAMSSPVQQQPLLQEPFAVLSRANDQQQLTRERYLASSHLAVSTRARGSVLEDMLLRELGVERHILARVQSYQTAAQLVTATGALLTLPARIAQRLVTQYSLRSWPMPIAVPATRLQVYWHAAYENDPALTWLLKNLQTVTEVPAE